MGENRSLLRSALEVYRQEGFMSLLEKTTEYVVEPERRKRQLSKTIGERFRIWPACVTLRRPVFVVGNPRSGTSLFVRCFGQHQSLAEWSEAGQVWDENYYDKGQNHELTAADLTEDDRERIRNAFLSYTLLDGKERLVNKHPRNSLRINFIEEIFPNAAFIHVVRHPIGAVDSMVRRSQEAGRRNRPFGGFVRPPGWKDNANADPVTQFSRCWKRVNEYIMRECGENCSTVKYEDFCESPLEVIRAQHRAVDLEQTLSPDQLPDSIENQNRKSFNNFTESEKERLWDITEGVAEDFDYSRTPV